jgi:lysophospholipase L1-like esterase
MDNGYSVQSASIAPAASLTSLEVRPGTSRPLTFAGRAGVAVGPGATVLSDPVSMPIRAGEPVLVTVTASAGNALLKGGLSEAGGCSTSEVSNAATAPPSAFPGVGNVHWLRSLLVDGRSGRLAAALGDSITEGPGPRYAGDYPRWTDVLGRSGLPIVNAGVGGNALTRPGMFGTASGIDRASALLAEPGLTDLIICMGTNDLAFGQTDAQVLTGLDTVIRAARAKNLRVWVCTISARQKTGWTTTRESRRESINAAILGSWLRDRGATPIDTDSALRDPSAPTYLRASFDSGDHLHPNAEGSYAIGAAAAHALGLPVPPVTEPAPAGV